MPAMRMKYVATNADKICIPETIIHPANPHQSKNFPTLIHDVKYFSHLYIINNKISMNSEESHDSDKGWCPPGRTKKIMNGICYCDYVQYSVKPRCLIKEPSCFIEDLDNGYTYYGQNSGVYITRGKNRIES